MKEEVSSLSMPLNMMEDHLHPEIQMLMQHPFLLAIEHAALSKSQIAQFARQYAAFQTNFPRYLAAVVSSIPDEDTRMPIVKYLWDVHGDGDDSKSLQAMYKLFTSNVDPFNECGSEEFMACTAKYTNTLFDLFFADDCVVALGTLGLGTDILLPQESELVLAGFQRYDHLSTDGLTFWSMQGHLARKYYPLVVGTLERIAISESERSLALKSAREAVQARSAFWEGLALAIAPDYTMYDYKLHKSHAEES